MIHHLHGNSTEKVKAFAYTCNICSEIYFCRQYLNMKKWQILPLYWYRSVLYGLKMLRYQDFRKYVGEYVKRTGLELKKDIVIQEKLGKAATKGTYIPWRLLFQKYKIFDRIRYQIHLDFTK